MKLIVLGGGPAGVMAALRARELGADVTLLEANRLGGTACARRVATAFLNPVALTRIGARHDR
jgi:pyruvate/2-oxoglutarate dehydrogenase complex dihydrolipoamide dehydrogenase (E3) component